MADEPFRYSPALQLPWSTHSNPSVVPLHDPVVYCEEPHLVFEQDVHVPLAVEDAPLRKRPLPHEGWSLQSPLAVTECPLRNWLLVHVGWALHLNPSVLPLHEPVRYCEGEHWALLHDVQVPEAVVDEPFRNWDDEHVGRALQL